MDRFNTLKEFSVPQLKTILTFLEEQTGFTDLFPTKDCPIEKNRNDFYDAIYNLITYSK